MAFTEIKNRIKAQLTFDVNKEIADIINENGTFITGLLKKQLARGKDSKGNNVTVFGRDYYSDRTVFEKERKGQETRWITNYDSGTFYASLYVYASGTSFIFDSAVPHFSEILIQSGEVIMELDQENITILRNQVIVPQLQIRYNARLNGL